MKKKKWMATSGVVFAIVFLVSAIFGDSFLYGKDSYHVAAAEESGKVQQENETFQIKAASDTANSADDAEVSDEVLDEITDAIVELSLAADIPDKEAGTEEPAEEKTPVEEVVEQESSKEEALEEEPSEESDEKEKESQSVDFVIANVDDSLNIRTAPSTDAEIIGKLYRGAKAQIVERGKEWTQITSGGLEGYVSSDYLMFDEEAILGAEVFGHTIATVETDALRIRKAPGTDSGVFELADKGTRMDVAILTEEEEAELPDGWVAVQYTEEQLAYVSSDFVTVSIELEEAISIEEERRILEEKRQEEARAAQAAAAAKALEDAKNQTVGVTNRNAVSISDEELYLLAGVVHMEAGNQPYEGKLAVANVVINRLLSGRWGNSISSVVYARGQFTGAASGLLQRYLDEGPNSGSIKAAAEAVSGVNNIGSYMSFCTLRVADFANYKNYTIIGDHCFH